MRKYWYNQGNNSRMGHFFLHPSEKSVLVFALLAENGEETFLYGKGKKGVLYA